MIKPIVRFNSDENAGAPAEGRFAPDSKANIIWRTSGKPEKDPVQIFINNEVLTGIRKLSNRNDSCAGFLLGKYHLQNKPAHLEILSQLPLGRQFLSAYSLDAWTQLDRMLSARADLTLVGWYHCRPLKADEALTAHEIHTHQMKFGEPWQIAMLVSPSQHSIFLFGQEEQRQRFRKFCGYTVFEQKEEEININLLETPVKMIPSTKAALPKELLTIKDRLRLSNDRLNILIEKEILETIYRNTQAHGLDESGGVLLGEYWPDENILHIAEQIPARYTQAGRAHLTFTPETWDEINQERSKYPDLLMAGWYHSHPGFGVFLSKYDYFIHEKFFNNLWQVALVVDSVRRKWDFFGWHENRIIRFRRITPVESPDFVYTISS